MAMLTHVCYISALKCHVLYYVDVIAANVLSIFGGACLDGI